MQKKRRRRRRKVKANGFFNKLRQSPINYFSDLFIISMVLAWIIVIIAMLIAAIYSTLHLADNTIWSDLGVLVAVPMSAGGAIWMIKNAVQHAIANQKGQQAKMDFPKIDDTELSYEDEREEQNSTPAPEIIGDEDNELDMIKTFLG